MKPHLPLNLRKALLAIYTAAIGMALTSTSTTAALTPTQTIGQGNQVIISTTEDYQINNNAYILLDGGILDTQSLQGAFLIGAGSEGILELKSGTWTQYKTSLTVGSQTGGEGTLLVTGGNFSIDSNSTSPIAIGEDNGKGLLAIDGGNLTIETKTNVGFNQGIGTISIKNGSLTTTAEITLGGSNGAENNGGTGTAIISDGGMWDAIGGISIIENAGNGITLDGGTLKIDSFALKDGGTLTWTSGTMMTDATIETDQTFTVTGDSDCTLVGELSLDGNLVVDGKFSLSEGLLAIGKTIGGNGTLIIDKQLSLGSGSFQGDVILSGNATLDGTIGTLDTNNFALTITNGTNLTITGNSTSTINGGLIGQGTLNMDAPSGTLNLTAQGGFSGTLTLDNGFLYILAPTTSPDFDTLAAINVNGGWLELQTDLTTVSLSQATGTFLNIINNATLTVDNGTGTILEGIVALGSGNDSGTLISTGDLTVKQLDDGAYGTLDASGHTLTIEGISTGMTSNNRLTLNANNIVINPANNNTGFGFVNATATETLQFILNGSKEDVFDSSLNASKLAVFGTSDTDYVQISDSVLNLATGTTVENATLVFSREPGASAQSYNIKDVSLVNGGNLVINDSTVSFDKWEDFSSNGTVYLSQGLLIQNTGSTDATIINSKVDGTNQFGIFNPAGNGTLATNGNLTLAGTGNELEDDTIQSAMTLTLEGSYTTLSGSRLLGQDIVLNPNTDMEGSNLSVMKNTNGDSANSLSIGKNTTLSDSYINTLKTEISSQSTLTLRGSHASIPSELGDIDLTGGDNALILEGGNQSNFRSYRDNTSSQLTISDSSLTQTEQSGDITVLGTTTITNTAADEQAKLVVQDSIALTGNNTIAGIENGEKAIVSSNNILRIGGTGSTSSITDAELKGKTFSLQGKTTVLDRNSITGDLLHFESTGDGNVTINSLVTGINASYTNVLIGNDNDITGTLLQITESTQFNNGSLNLSGPYVSTTITNGKLLELNNVTRNGTPGSVVNLGDVSLNSGSGLTTLAITNGTQASASDMLNMGDRSFIAIDGEANNAYTSLSLGSSDILTGPYAGISVANNGHLIFRTGDITITEDNKNKIQWDASSEIKTLAGNFIFDGVKDDLTSPTPIRGEISAAGSYSVILRNGAQVFATGVTSHNLNLHDPDTILQIHISDQSSTTWSKMAIADTLSIRNGATLTLVNKSVRADNLGSLGTVIVNGGTLSATGQAGSYLTASSISAANGSSISLNTIQLDGGISTVADALVDTVNLTNATVNGNITVNTGDILNMTGSTVTGTVWMDNSSLNIRGGTNTIDTLALANNAKVTIDNGATLNVNTTGIGFGSDMQINGTVTGNVTLMGGTATLASTGIVDGNLGIQGGTLSYGGGTVNGELSFLADPYGNSVINLGSSWTLASGKALAVDGNGIINMGAFNMMSHGLTGNGDLTLTGSGTFTFDKTGTHTGNIILKDSVSITASGANHGMGTSGSLIAESGIHAVTFGIDQGKGLVINKGATVNLTTTRDLQLGGLINNQGSLNVSAGGNNPILYLTKTGSDLGNLNLMQGTIALSTWQTSPNLIIQGNDITSSAGTIFDLRASSLTANSMNLLGTLKGNNNSQLILANGLKTASMELTGTTVSARSIQANATSLGNNSKLTATEDLTLSGITNIGNNVSLAGGNVSLSSAVTLTSGNLSLTAGHKLLLNSGTYIWTNSTVDVHDSTTLAEGVSLTLGGGSQSLGTLNGSTNSTLALTGGANAQAATILFAEGSIMLDGASSLSTTTAADSTISSLTLSGDSSLKTAGDLEITTLEDGANGSIISDGDLTIDNDITTSDTLSLIAGGTLTLQGDSSTINGDDSLLAGETISVDGDLTMNGANASIEAIGEISLNNITMTGEGSSITTGGTLAISGSGNLEHTTIETGTLHLVEDGDGTTMKDVSLTAAHTIVDAGKMLRLMAGSEYSLGITSITGDLNLGGNNQAANAATVTAESMSIGYSFDDQGRQVDGTLTVNTGSSLTVRHSLTSTGSTSIAGSVTAGTIVLSGNANDLEGYGSVDGGTLESLSSMDITNATLGRTTLISGTDMTIAGTVTDNGGSTLTSREGSIILNAELTGDGNTLTAANGTVDINAAISGDNLSITAQDLVIDAAMTTEGGNITVTGTMDVNAAATLTDVTLDVARTDITGNGSSLTVSNTETFGKLGDVTVADYGSLTLTGTTAGTASSLSADISVSNNSTASLTNTALTGSILVSADSNTLTLDRTSVSGNVTLLGTTNTLSMTDSSIGQTLTMDGGQFDLYGTNTVGELLLNTTNINLTLHNGATLNAVGKETVIDKNGLYLIEGTHTGNIRIGNGTIDLGSVANAGTLNGSLTIEEGTLNYNNADSAISDGNAITLAGGTTTGREINVNADWDASGNTLVANADGTINLAEGNLEIGAIASGNGNITINGSNDLTIDGSGSHTGDIVLNGTVDVIAGAANALGTDGTLVVNGAHKLTITGDQNKDILLATRTDDLVIDNAADVVLNGAVDSRGFISKVGSGTLTLEDAIIDNLEVNGGLVVSTGENIFGDLTADGGDISLGMGDNLMSDADLNAIDGTISLTGVTASNGGNMTAETNGGILIHDSNLKMNNVLNDGLMTFDQNSSISLDELTSNGTLNIGSTDIGDITRVDVFTNATLSGTTTINTGATLDVTKNVKLINNQVTVNGTLTAGNNIALEHAQVSGTGGTISAKGEIGIDSDSSLTMGGNSTVKAGTDMTVAGNADIEGSLSVGNNLNVSGSLTSDGTTKVGGSLAVTDGNVTLNGTANVSDKTTVSGNGSLTLDSTGAGDLGNVTVNDDGSLTVTGNGNSVNADNITMNGNASGSISDTVLNLNGGRGEITLNDASSLDIANTIVNGSISTTNTSSTDSTHLGLDTVDINGDLTVVGGDLVLSNDNTVSGSLNISDTVNVTVNDENGNPGTLVVKEGTLIDPNASLTIDEKSYFTSNVTMTGGSFTVNGNAEGNNFNGAISFKPNDDLTYPGASSPVVTINGTHNQNMGITVDADASINVNGTLNINGTLSSGSNGDDTLSFNANGETGEIVINSTNEGFEDDIAIGGGTLVVNANEAIGKDGTLSVTGEGVTLKNTADGATVSKDIATNGNGLTIQTDQDFILAGQINAAGDTIVKSGDAELVLSHDPALNDAKSIIGTLDQTEGDILMNGTDYTVGNLNIAEGDQNFTSLGGNTIHNVTAGEGSSITLTGTNAAANGSSADTLGNSETNDGKVNLDGATLNTEGTILGLAELNVGTSSNGVGSNATLTNSAGTITSTTVETGSELTLDGSTVQGNDLVNSGTTTVKDTELTLDEAIYIRDGGELNIDGASIIDSDIVLSDGTVNILKGSSSIITADSTLDFNEGMLRSAGDRLVNVHENFTMEGTIKMTDDGEIMVDTDKTMNVNGGFSGSGELFKTGQGTLAFNKENASYDGTLHLAEGILAATASNAYGSSSTLCIHGNGVSVLTGTHDGAPVVFDSGLTVDGDYAFNVDTLSHTTWNGQLAGTQGTMTKTGNATLAINNANSQGFATAIKVNEGDLALNGNIGSNVTLARGTMLSGNGSTTGHVDARNDDTVIEIGEAGKANSGVETLTLGSAAFEHSEADCMGVYKTGTKTIVDLDLANNASDKLVVTGKADLNNSLVEIRKGAYTPTQERGVADGTRFHIVDAGELTGTFHDEVQHDLYLLNAHLENTATGSDLVLSINHKGANKNDNQSGISGVIEGIDNDGIATGELLDMINAFKHTRSEAEAKAALDSVGGTRLSTMMSSMLAGNVNHLRNLRNSMGTGSYAISVTPDAKGGMISHGRSNTEVWVTPTAGYNKANGDSNAPGFSRSSWGAMMGAERSLDANTMLGISLGYDYARTEVLGATDETDTYNIDLYGTYRNGAWLNRASFGIGFHDFTNDRFVTVGDRFAHMSRGAASGTSLNFAYELSYTFQLDAKSTIAPLFTVESSLGWIGSYSEKGDIGNAGLHLDRQDAWATILGLGGRYTRDFSVISSAPSARFEAMALMTFDVGDQGAPLTASFMGAPGRNFTVNPAANNRIGALIGAGATVPFNERLSAFGGTSFEFRSGTRDFTANIGVRYSF